MRRRPGRQPQAQQQIRRRPGAAAADSQAAGGSSSGWQIRRRAASSAGSAGSQTWPARATPSYSCNASRLSMRLAGWMISGCDADTQSAAIRRAQVDTQSAAIRRAQRYAEHSDTQSTAIRRAQRYGKGIRMDAYASRPLRLSPVPVAEGVLLSVVLVGGTFWQLHVGLGCRLPDDTVRPPVKDSPGHPRALLQRWLHVRQICAWANRVSSSRR